VFESINKKLLKLLLPFELKGNWSYARIKKLYELYIKYLENPTVRIPRREYFKHRDLFMLLSKLSEHRMFKEQIKNLRYEYLRLLAGKDINFR